MLLSVAIAIPDFVVCNTSTTMFLSLRKWSDNLTYGGKTKCREKRFNVYFWFTRAAFGVNSVTVARASEDDGRR